MTGPILYSTNPFMSFDIGCRLRKGLHHVWCSEVFDPRTQAGTALGASVAATSDPFTLACTLFTHVRKEERHSDLLKRYKKTFRLLANDWEARGEINSFQAQDIRDLVKMGVWQPWRPLVYVIPRRQIEAEGRLIEVPFKDRAGHGPEYKIVDLRTEEFDVVEWQHG